MELILWARESEDRIEHLHQMDLLAEETGRRVERQAAIAGWIAIGRQTTALLAFALVLATSLMLAHDDALLDTFLRSLGW